MSVVTRLGVLLAFLAAGGVFWLVLIRLVVSPGGAVSVETGPAAAVSAPATATPDILLLAPSGPAPAAATPTPGAAAPAASPPPAAATPPAPTPVATAATAAASATPEGRAPWILLPQPAVGGSVASGPVEIGARARGDDPITRITLSVDGTPVPSSLDRRSSTIWRAQAQVDLSPGAHQVEAIAEDAAGRTGGFHWTFQSR